MTGEGMTPRGYALALVFVTESPALPLPVRVGWLAHLRRFEPCPRAVREAALEAHRTGHLRGGKLTSDGVRVALEALSGAALPPGSIHTPRCGAGGEA